MSHSTDSLQQLVHAHRARWQWLRILEACGWAASGTLGYFLFAIVLDNATHLPTIGRLSVAAGLAAVVVWLARRLLGRWRQRHASEDQIALAMEQRAPGGMENRLINTLQIGREGGAPDEIQTALVEENWRHLADRPLPGATAAKPAALWLLLAAGLAAVAVIGWWWQPARFATSAKRILLPFASIDPVYRTVLVVEPGDIEAVGDVTLTIRIRGQRPEELEVLLAENDRRSAQAVAVPTKGVVTYTLRNITASTSYAVRGGDFTSAYYRIEVPTPARLASVRTTYRYPKYTGLPEKTVDGNDLEAVTGTLAEAHFLLDHPADEATLIVRGPAAKGPAAKGAGQSPGSPAGRVERRSDLKKVDDKEFFGGLLLDDETEYAVETRQGDRPPSRSPWHTVRVLPDEVPRVELTGVPAAGEMSIDSHLPLTVKATDDFGLARVALFARRAGEKTSPPASPPNAKDTPAKDSIAKDKTATPGDTATPGNTDGWIAIGQWLGGAAKQEHTCALNPAVVGAVEGDRIEMVVRASDKHPDRADRWTSGAVQVVLVAGEGAQLQIAYEQILRSEAQLAEFATREQELYAQTNAWVRKFDGPMNDEPALKKPASDDEADEGDAAATGDAPAIAPPGGAPPAIAPPGGTPAAKAQPAAEKPAVVQPAAPLSEADLAKRVTAVNAAAVELSAAHDQLRQQAGQAAREMVAQAGSLRLSLGMLADTEMVRSIRILDSVVTRDDDAARRAALAEARATQQRTLQSLQQLQEQFTQFRQEWELAHMTPFLRMLADRQAALAEATRSYSPAADVAATTGDGPAAPVASAKQTALRRQAKLTELCGLAETAFSGLAERLVETEELLAEAFGAAATSLSDDALQQPLAAAEAALTADKWNDAAAAQKQAAERLDAIYTLLHEAQKEAARRVLAGLEERAESDLAAQAELEKLKAGSDEDLLDEPDGLKLEDIIHLAQVNQSKKEGGKDDKPYVDNYLFPDSAVSSLQQADTGKRQQFEILKLATSPGKTPSFPQQSDRQGNRVKPHIQEKFEDLVGDLLEEEDEMNANYESFNLNAAFNINEPGEIGKQGGDLNSTAAAAATGNQKPPTTNVGGASRVGRQGARAHGAAIGDESINRRGRDKVQEGQERSPDQAGSVKETKSDDPQEDTSTGIGGRKVESDEAHFSLSDSGEWTDDMIDRMDAAKEKQAIVERQAGKLDAAIGDMLRDHNSQQEQIIERLKTIRKDLKNLYLPTEHLDELIDQMQANLSSLNERPSAEVFRLQQQTLAQVRGALQVFHQAHSGFQASVPRDQAIRGRVLDDPARAVPPGYETAVKNYYHKLATP